MKFLMKYLLLSFVSINCFAQIEPLTSEQQQEYKRRLASLTSIIAKCIIDPEVIVVVAENRPDIGTRDPNVPIPSTMMFEIREALDIIRLVPVLYLRGFGSGHIINVQLNRWPLKRSGGSFPAYFLKSNEEGTWLYFIRPVTQLSEVIRKVASSDISEKLEAMDKDLSPHTVAKKLGFDSWLRKDNWFELAERNSAVLIGFSIRDLEPIHEYGELFLEQLNSQNQLSLSLREQRRDPATTIVLDDEQFEAIKKLLEMFSADGKVPSVDDLIAMKSPFADAILAELSKSRP